MKQITTILLCAFLMAAMSCGGGKKVSDTASANSSKMGLETPGVISFAAANERYSADGTFKKWKFSKVSMDKGKIESLDADIDIDLTSIWEKSDKLTDHLKANDYFDVAKYTTANLNIKNVRAKGDKYVADLQLKMRGVTQKMESEFEVISKKPMTVKGTAMVDRGLFTIGVENTSVPNLIEVSYNTVIPQ